MISRVVSRLTSASPDDAESGFTLVEVIWAMFLMGIVAMASLMLFLTGMTSVSELQRQQSAASLAATAIDHARSVAGTGVNFHGTSGLVKGRSQSAVVTAWNELAALDPSLTADMNLGGTGHPAEAWDVALGMTEADQWVPIRTGHTVGTQSFTVDTLVGICYRLKTSPNLNQACTRARSSVDDAHMFRVRVLVRWDTGTGEQQTYTVSTLVDPTEDPVWNTSLMPYAQDDEITVIAGDPTSYHAIVSNDTVDPGIPNPIWNNTQPAAGSYTLGTGTQSDGILFTPPSNVSGTVTFTYELRDPAGQQSPEPATVMVHILPKPVSDTLSVLPGTTTELNELLFANDIGVPNLSPQRSTTIHPFVDPAVDYFATEEVTPAMEAARANDIAALAARGVTMGPDGVVRFQAPAELGTSTTFSYYLVDDGTGADVARYPNIGRPATVTITTEEPAPEAANGEYRFDATSRDTWHAIPWRVLTGSEDGVRIRVTGITGGSATHARIDTAPAVGAIGDILEFRTASNNLGIYRITYVLETERGTASEPAVLTVTVSPDAVDATSTVRRTTCTLIIFCTTRTVDIDLRTISIPNTTGVRITDITPTTCGSTNRLSDSTVRFTAPTSAGTCTFTYRMETTGSPNIKSDAATVRVTVTN